jgi:uroporphyrinogen decarboxylase
MGLSPRERVLTALEHREPDRVPVDFGAHRSSGISAIAYARLRKALGLEPRTIRVYDPVQQLAIIDEDVLDRFSVDTIELGRGFALEDEHWADWVLPDGTPCQMPRWAMPEREAGRWVVRSGSGRVVGQMPDGALYFEQCYWPFLEEEDLERLPAALDEVVWSAMPAPPGPLVSGPDGTRALAEGARRLRESTDRAIVALFGGNLLESGQMLYRNDRFLMMLAAEPARAEAFLDRLVAHHLDNLGPFLEAVGPHVDVVLFGDDLGMQTGPQISPAMYVRYFQPRHARMWRRAKELCGVKVLLHCCGGVRPLLAHLIEAGLDAINPVQTSCKGMDPASLKQDFGSSLTFWGGGCDTQRVLPRGTPSEVRAHVRERISTWKPGGGFVFQQVHNILADVPPENVIAMFEAVAESRDSPRNVVAVDMGGVSR